MKRFFGFFLKPWVTITLGVICVALLVWFATLLGLLWSRRHSPSPGALPAAMLCAFAGATATLGMLVAFTVGALVTLSAVLRSEWSRRGAAPGKTP